MQAKLSRQKEDKKEDGKTPYYIPVSVGEDGHDQIIVLIAIRERDQTSAMGSGPASTTYEARDETSRLRLSSPGSFGERKKPNQQLRYYLV